MRTARLDEIVRQQDPALKSTVELLATGHVPLHSKHSNNRDASRRFQA